MGRSRTALNMHVHNPCTKIENPLLVLLHQCLEALGRGGATLSLFFRYAVEISSKIEP